MLSHSRPEKAIKLLTVMSALLYALPIHGQLALTTAQIAKKVTPSVVVIQGKSSSGDVLGSGFIVSKDGKIVTNLHVVRDMKTATVQMANGEIFDSVSVLAIDERRDLAVLQIAGFNLPLLEFGNSDVVTVGESVVIVGSPRGLEGTVTAGILSSVRDSGDGFKILQTDAAVNPGNSGGPLLNSKGQAIGVVSSKLRSAENLNFAIPINYARGLMNVLHAPMTFEQMRGGLAATLSGLTASIISSPSLKETLDWLREQLPLAVVNLYYYSDGRPNSVTTRALAWNLDSCVAVIDSETRSTHGKNDDAGVSTFIYKTRTTMPLGKIIEGRVDTSDQSSKFSFFSKDFVFLSGDRQVYFVELLAGAAAFTSEMSDTSTSTYRFYKPAPPAAPYVFLRKAFNVSFSDEALAKRVLAAFLHAADLCRTKEPF